MNSLNGEARNFMTVIQTQPQQETQSLKGVGKWQESSPCPAPGQAGPHRLRCRAGSSVANSSLSLVRHPTPKARPVSLPQPQYPGPGPRPHAGGKQLVGSNAIHLFSPEMRRGAGSWPPSSTDVLPAVYEYASALRRPFSVQEGQLQRTWGGEETDKPRVKPWVRPETPSLPSNEGVASSTLT